MKFAALRRLLPAALATGTFIASPVTVTAQEAPAAGDGKSLEALVWRIKGEKSTVYLAGSIHLLHKEDYPLPAPYQAAYEDSARLAFEVPPQDMASPESAKKMQDAGSYEEGKTIGDHIDKETLDSLHAYLKTVGVPPDAVKQFRPWMIALTISMIETMKTGASPEHGVDQHFAGKAEDDDKPTAGLETVDDQVSIFASMTPEAQDQALKKTLQELDGISDQFKTMLDAWKSGDAKALHAQLFKEAEDFPDLMEALLYKRNANWIDQIVGYIEGDENVMVIVGAGHLVGEKSVIDLLEKKGYKLEKLTYAPAAKE